MLMQTSGSLSYKSICSQGKEGLVNDFSHKPNKSYKRVNACFFTNAGITDLLTFTVDIDMICDKESAALLYALLPMNEDNMVPLPFINVSST